MMGLFRVVPVVLSGFLLSGCLLPTHFTVASWAIDGLSVMFTKKSVADHGISAVAQKDCALWRGFTEGEICREDDSITAIADAGYISNDGKSTPATAFADSTADVTTVNTKAIYQNSIFSDMAFKDKLMDDPVSWQNDFADDDLEDAVVSADISSDVPSDVIEVEALQSPEELMVEMPIMEVSVDASKTALLYGNYLVIGSFGNWSNASQFAKRHEDLGAQIVSADVNVGRVFRIIVGPYTASTRDVLESSTKQAGIKAVWGMKVSEDFLALNWEDGMPVQVASVSE